MSNRHYSDNVCIVDPNVKLVTNIKGHHRLLKNVNGVRTAVDVFTTKYTPGANIRCAILGTVFQNLLVGTTDEGIFFKVCMSGVFPENSYGKHLYFQSPTDYEDHFHITLSDSIKDSWKMNYDEMMKNAKLDDV